MSDTPMQERNKRAQDRGWLCWVAARAADFWDFIDRRDIDKHVVSMAIMLGTYSLTRWAMDYASLAFTTSKSGVEIAAIIGAVTAPYMALQAAALAFYFKARQ